ncbi:MAG: M81 family metallopeptidase [Pseudomonadota bacterium]
MKIFAATLITETNTFAVVPTGRGDYETYGIHLNDASLKDPAGVGAMHAELKRMAAADGHEVVESLCAFAQPAGRTLRAVYEEFRERILADLKQAMPIDAVQLYLHGAMVAEGYDDCEGDLIECVRQITGPSIHIGVELDLHCHYTEKMQSNADAIICYKEYPHTDILERERELYKIMVDHVAKKISPVTAVYDTRMVAKWATTSEPMQSFVARMKSFEGKDGILSVSFGHGFPAGDVADSGARFWVIADGDADKAAKLAKQLGQEIWDQREADLQTPPLSEVLKQANQSKATPVVLADTGDNPGGGAMSDATFVLRALLDAGISNAVLGYFWDVGAIHVCRSAGVGATLNLRIGGKCGPMSGDPVDLKVTVRAIHENQFEQGLGMRMPLGTVVWVQSDDGLDLVLNSIRGQVFSPETFKSLGIDVLKKQLIVVKSNQHFHQGFAPIAGEIIYLMTPGTTDRNMAAIPYKIRSLNYWPRVENPFAD